MDLESKSSRTVQLKGGKFFQFSCSDKTMTVFLSFVMRDANEQRIKYVISVCVVCSLCCGLYALRQCASGRIRL